MMALCVMTAVSGAELAIDALDRLQHDDAGLHVERAGRLVAEEHLGPLGDGAGDGDALLLAAGKLRREMIHAGRQADQLQGLLGRMRIGAISVMRATFSRAVRLGIRL